MVFDAQTGEDGLRAAIDNLCKKAEEAVDGGANYIVLSDQDIDESHGYNLSGLYRQYKRTKRDSCPVVYF